VFENLSGSIDLIAGVVFALFLIVPGVVVIRRNNPMWAKAWASLFLVAIPVIWLGNSLYVEIGDGSPLWELAQEETTTTTTTTTEADYAWSEEDLRHAVDYCTVAGVSEQCFTLAQSFRDGYGCDVEAFYLWVDIAATQGADAAGDALGGDTMAAWISSGLCPASARDAN
jgi:hypothetical protein